MKGMKSAQKEEPPEAELRTAEIIWLETKRGVPHFFPYLFFKLHLS